MIGKVKYIFCRTWHKSLMKYNYTLYKGSADPSLKQKHYDKASFHATKILRN